MEDDDKKRSQRQKSVGVVIVGVVVDVQKIFGKQKDTLHETSHVSGGRRISTERYLFLHQVVDVSVLRDDRAHAYHPSVFITHSQMRSLQNHPAKEFAFLTSSHHIPTNPSSVPSL
jgi:hypothetical protein